jgi:uncharacterized membrane protein
VDFLVLKWLHIGAMFMATALAVGPFVVLYLVARSGDLSSTRRAFSFSTTIGRIGGAMYGLGILFGALAALTGAIDLTAAWLLTAYVLVVLLAVNGLLAERWMRRVQMAAEASGSNEVDRLARAPLGVTLLTIMIVVTLAIIYVMVAKPTLF